MDVEIEEKKDWSLIRLKLNQACKYDNDWENAIELFDKRIKRKFFDPVEKIIKTNKLKGEGFTIVTVQCALIEMFAAFKRGKVFNHEKKSASPKYEYKESKQMFTSLLRSASIFQDNFWQINGNGKTVIDKPFNANDFYKDVRCGLMHEARTKGNWHINATPLDKSVKNEKVFIVSINGKTKVYRTILHYRLLQYLSNYEDDLRKDSISAEELRKFFARKMDNLFDFQPDKNVWWIN